MRKHPSHRSFQEESGGLKHIVATISFCMLLWGVMSGDRPGPVEDLEDPIGVLQVGLSGTAPARDTPRSAYDRKKEKAWPHEWRSL
jgi:hypothetical protein